MMAYKDCSIGDFRRSVVMASTIALLAAPLVGLASTPSGLKDLVGERAAGAESAMKSRGYHLNHLEQGADRIWSYWWNPGKDKCVVVATVDGRYDAITETPAPDCRQTGQVEGGKNNDAAAAAVAAAAILGVVALASQSHHRNDGQPHYQDANNTAEFERGYRDGLYHQGYHNYNRSNEYSGGYERGQEQRDYETPYRSSAGYHGGYSSFVNVADLQGARASSGDGELRRRGFTDVDGFKKDNKAHTFWWNGSTSQCVHVVTKDGYFKAVKDASREACA